MLEHCKGVQAVAVDRKAEGCQLFGERELVSTGKRDRVAVDQAVDQWDCSCREEPSCSGSSVG